AGHDEQHEQPDGDRRARGPRARRPGQGPGADRPRDEAREEQAQVEDRRLTVRSGAHTVTYGASWASIFSPTPLTSPSSSTAVKRPCSERQSMIRWARTGPTPGRVSRVVRSAVLRLTGAPSPPEPSDEAAVPPSPGGPAGAAGAC